jgi:membrane fusion protein (multidrug efflux system)
MRVREIRARLALLAISFVLACVAVACNAKGVPPAESSQPPAATTPTVDVVRVVQRPLDITLEMPGELDPYEAVAIYPKVSGYVKTIRVDRGSNVRAGDLMAVLDAPELVAQRAEAQSKVQGAEAQLAVARTRADADASTFEKLKAASATPGVVAGNDLMIAQKTVEAHQGQIAAAEQTVEAARQAVKSVTDLEGYLRIIAPFDGVVTERNVHPGALVGAGTGSAMPMLRVAQNTRLRLVVPVPEAYIASVTEGTPVPFAVHAYPGQTFLGTIARIAHAVDPKTRTMAVELDVMNKDGRLAPGAFCQVRWPVHRTGPSLLVPNGSVATTTDRMFVVRVRNGRTEWVDVKTGLAQGPLIEVFGDLQAGDEIAMRGTDELRAGTQVLTKSAKPAQT